MNGSEDIEEEDELVEDEKHREELAELEAEWDVEGIESATIFSDVASSTINLLVAKVTVGTVDEVVDDAEWRGLAFAMRESKASWRAHATEQ